MQKVIIDTNILVSALLSKREDSPTVQILELLFNGVILPLVSDTILEEYREVLKRKKFGFSSSLVDSLVDEIRKDALEIFSTVYTEVKLPDEKDRPFFEILHNDEDAVLITGNLKHFPHDNRIMSAREFIEYMNHR